MNINDYMEEYRSTPGALLVDLRDPQDYIRAHIPGAINIEPARIREEIRKIATFRTPIYVYCYAGIRSAQAESLLKAKGYQVFNIGSFEEYTGEKEGERIHMELKELRKEKGLSQAEMAQSIGVKPVTVSAIETGRMKISAKIAERVRDVYGVDMVVPEKKKRERKAAKGTRKTGAKRGPKPQGKKPGRKPGRQKKSETTVVFKMPDGKEISLADILAKTGEVSELSVRLDEGKADWVRGEESGSVNLWD